MDVSDARRLRQPEKENTRLKKMVADQALDISILKDILSKNFWGPRHARKRCAVCPKAYTATQRLACATLGVNRSMVRRPHPPDRDADACGNWQRSGGASASCGCMSCYGVKGCGESQTDGKDLP